MTEPLILKINGEYHSFKAKPETPLIYLLRNDLQLTAAKYGCGMEQCGACKVIVDGQAVPSCRQPVGELVGSNIITLEGIGLGSLDPIQEAFSDEQAFQCGFCTAGMITTARALLDQNPNPTDREIQSAMERNLCRCGTYPRIIRAVQRAAGRIPRPAVSTDIQEPITVEEIGALPSVLSAPSLIDDWLQFNVDNTITLFTGKVEIGQGIKTAVAQIAAEELDVDINRFIVVTADTAHTPNEGRTAGSMSLETTGRAIRQVAAEARRVLLDLAFEELEAETPVAELSVTDGVVRDPATGRHTSYWKLIAGRQFERSISGKVSPKSSSTHQLIGQPARQIDSEARVTGRLQYVHDISLPDMVHGRVLRPPSYDAQLVSCDTGAVELLPGVIKVIHDGRFVAVIAEREYEAVVALEKLRAVTKWQLPNTFPSQHDLDRQLRQEPCQTFLLEDAIPQQLERPLQKLQPTATHTLSATYHKPYTMHASLGPSAAVAQLTEDHLTIWTHSQGVYPTRAIVSPVLGIPEENIRIVHHEGAGCYGHNGADDAALDAALLAKHVPNRPISLKWMRSDEHQWEPYGPAMSIEIQASVDDSGHVVSWNFEGWSYPHLGRGRPSETESGLLAAWHLAESWSQPAPQPSLFPHVGGHRNSVAYYDFCQRQELFHFVPNSPLRVSTLRGLGAFGNIFAIESMMDELAQAAQQDPLSFRLNHLSDERARAVLLAAADKAHWDSPTPQNIGRGVAFARYKNKQCYAAVVVEVEITDEKIRLVKATIAADAGQIVNPSSLSNQLEGGFIQAASWALYEQVNFNEQHITSTDWETYPIMRMPDTPEVEVVLLNRPEQPFLGSGEAMAGPTPAAIANAVYDAVGIRLRNIPFHLPADK